MISLTERHRVYMKKALIVYQWKNMTSLTERRRVYMKKARDVAKVTNNIRGLFSFVSDKSKKSI